jgi:hypothetical protein
MTEWIAQWLAAHASLVALIGFNAAWLLAVVAWRFEMDEAP